MVVFINVQLVVGGCAPGQHVDWGSVMPKTYCNPGKVYPLGGGGDLAACQRQCQVTPGCAAISVCANNVRFACATATCTDCDTFCHTCMANYSSIGHQFATTYTLSCSSCPAGEQLQP